MRISNARKWSVLCLALLCLAVAGCLTAVDPATGEATRVLDPNAPLVTGGETLAEGIAALGPLFGPTGALLAGIAAGLLAMWRRIKPELAQARSQAEQYHAATAATVTAIEQFKEASGPETWEKLGSLVREQLTKQGLDPKVVENVIRAIRGLPPKA